MASWIPNVFSSGNSNKNNNSQSRSRQKNSNRQNKRGGNNYNPYANNGRQNNCTTQHNNCHNHQHQTQSQTYINNQMQQTAQAQTFIEHVDDTIQTISVAGKCYVNGQDSSIVNALCDGAVISLNMFAVSCEQLHRENNKDALDLGRKRAHDKLIELKSKNAAVYKLIEPHRNFMNLALNGQKNLRYKQDRVEPGAKALFERDTNEINDAFGQMITHQQKFNKSRDALLKPEINKKLAKQQQRELNEYRGNNNKYKSKNMKKSQSGSSKAQITDLFFTKSGKKSKFIDVNAVEQCKQARIEMDEEIFGSNDVYDNILPRQYMNAVLKLSKGRKWNGICKPIPCLILVPNKHVQRSDKTMVHIMPCYPNNNVTLNASLDLLELDENKIIKVENAYINKKGPLGYKSIKQQKEEERRIDIDGIDNGNGFDNDDVLMDGDDSGSNL